MDLRASESSGRPTPNFVTRSNFLISPLALSASVTNGKHRQRGVAPRTLPRRRPFERRAKFRSSEEIAFRAEWAAQESEIARSVFAPVFRCPDGPRGTETSPRDLWPINAPGKLSEIELSLGLGHSRPPERRKFPTLGAAALIIREIFRNTDKPSRVGDA